MASFRDIVGYFSNYKAIAIFSIAASSLFEIIDLVVPYTIGQILNVLSNQPLDRPLENLIVVVQKVGNFPEGQWLSLGVLLGIIFLVTVVRSPIQPWIGNWHHWAISLKARRDHFTKVLAKILTLPLGFYDENNPGRIAGRIARGIENHTWTYPEIAGQLIPKLARILGIFVMILVVAPGIAIAFLVSFVLILTYSFKHLRILILKEELLEKHEENTESRTSEIITNIKTVKSFATEAQEYQRQQRRFEREFKYLTYRIHKGYVNLHTWSRTVIQTCVFLILLFTLISTIRGDITLGHFVTTLTVSSMAYAELEPINELAEVFARRYASMRRFHDFIQLESGVDAASLEMEGVQDNPYKFTGKLEFNHLSFGYHSDRLILQNINLLVKPYQTVALVGRSGSGKSTLVKLLFRYFEPNQGSIKIDGENIRNLDVARYRRRLAIVHQDVDIFNGTVWDNLTYGNPQVDREKVKQACQVARVDQFIHELPQGYSTVVGERGVRLSGGQKQRLGIARALVVEPDILIFDEATSSLDYESERSIQLAMKSILGTRTTLIIAHRLSTIREADQIIVLDSGRIIEVGSHAELLNQGGIYHRLHSLQETGEILN
ncbi:ABC transporter ATP-binding protein [Pleurocapsa sp. PCC 7319]|uniref:ABC transporter ATP-binding protein n=1 Tax=Pleurocapsa sp. PCC 7319 TaxID=118161 RepID=UPI000349C689|nr:ABC transporter ATP-binding protein [Pleurocapsa sp. PCC 7319]